MHVLPVLHMYIPLPHRQLYMFMYSVCIYLAKYNIITKSEHELNDLLNMLHC